MPDMDLGTIDFYCFILFSLTLTLAWGHKIRGKENLLASFSRFFVLFLFLFLFFCATYQDET